MTDDVKPTRDGIPLDCPIQPKAKVIPIGTLTSLDVPVERVLDNARELEGVVVLGYTKDNEYHFASTYADGGTVLWLLEKLKQRLLTGST